ncbi:hypothetical protein DSM3645_03923 [Blastopirellula marina DSM 3645]|uniref:Uncharacterized protein n=1 Tax=Blastopirellula marina DSM 3645 TaxID=314230 RepID=A3ZV56_9BACT|nr:hypothetical protein DSM3645_03923 [Blastopirellula marina DSM 3645]
MRRPKIWGNARRRDCHTQRRPAA